MTNNKVILYLIIFFIIQSFLAIYAAKGIQVQGRYALIPAILLIFIVLKLREIDNSIVKYISSILIAFSMDFDVNLYSSMKGNFDLRNEAGMCIVCPEPAFELMKLVKIEVKK